MTPKMISAIVPAADIAIFFLLGVFLDLGTLVEEVSLLIEIGSGGEGGKGEGGKLFGLRLA